MNKPNLFLSFVDCQFVINNQVFPYVDGSNAAQFRLYEFTIQMLEHRLHAVAAADYQQIPHSLIQTNRFCQKILLGVNQVGEVNVRHHRHFVDYQNVSCT